MQKEFFLAECKEINNQIWFWDCLFLPKVRNIHSHVIHKAHNLPAAGHFSWHKIYDLIAHHYWWLKMVNLVWQFIHNCHTCKASKTSKNRYHNLLKPLSVSEHHWAHIFLNFIVELSFSKAADGHVYQNILVVVNQLTKMWHLIPCQFMTKKKTAHLFHQHVWKHHELSSTIISDHSTQFVTHFWDELCHCLDIKSALFTVYHSETDEQTENTNKILKQYLQIYVIYLQNDWVNWLLSAEFVTNNHVFETTQYSSFFTNYEQHFHMKLKPRGSWKASEGFIAWVNHDSADKFAEKMNQINENLQQQMCLVQAIYKDFMNHHRQPAPAYQVDDEMWLNIQNLSLKDHSSKKLASKYQGFYWILKIVSSHAYHLAISDNFEWHDVFHTNLLQPTTNDPLPDQVSLASFSWVNLKNLNKYKVKAILNFKVTQNSLHLLVKWMSYENSTWKSLDTMNTTTDVINVYYSHYSNKPDQVSWKMHHDYIQSTDESLYNYDTD